MTLRALRHRQARMAIILPLQIQVTQRYAVHVEMTRTSKFERYVWTIRPLESDRAEPLREHGHIENYAVLRWEKDRSIHRPQGLPGWAPRRFERCLSGGSHGVEILIASSLSSGRQSRHNYSHQPLEG